MFSDEQIERILYRYTSRQDEFNLSVLEFIARRLSNIADFDNLDTLHKEELIKKEVIYLQSLHKKYVKDQLKLLEDDLWWVAVVIYLESLKFYENQVDLQNNKELNEFVTQSVYDAKKSLFNVIKSPVFVVHDMKNPSKLLSYNFDKAYRTVVNEALTYSNVSKELQDVALKRTETQLFDSGVRYMIKNSSDDTTSVKNANTSIRFNVLDGVKNLINEMQKIMGKQFGANAVELSAHIYPAPDHAPAQGHQFSLEEVEKMQAGMDFKDLQGNSYVGFERNIGAWNCRHYFMQIKKGSKPQYTQKELDKILEDNEKGYTDENGKHWTLYECTQIQRRYEREIRNAKEKYLYGKALNDKNMMARSRNAVGRLTTRYKQFSNKCNIPAKLERIRVKDYK